MKVFPVSEGRYFVYTWTHTRGRSVHLFLHFLHLDVLLNIVVCSGNNIFTTTYSCSDVHRELTKTLLNSNLFAKCKSNLQKHHFGGLWFYFFTTDYNISMMTKSDLEVKENFFFYVDSNYLYVQTWVNSVAGLVGHKKRKLLDAENVSLMISFHSL